MYAPTIAAVNDRDIGYLGLFVVGAILGLMSFAMAMKWLLDTYRSLTLSLMIGLMIGSLRALWPWQSQERELLVATDPIGPVVALGLGLAVVALTIVMERYFRTRATQ
jgi:putative membrane protein